MTTRVLVLCTHNSARSILAEGMLAHWARRLGRAVVAHSAGSAPSGRINPHALAVLQAAGIEVAGLRSKSWDEFAVAGAPVLDLVITVCDSAAAETCPIWLGTPVQVHWGYPDPSAAPEATRRQAFELTRQAIGYRMLQLLQLPLGELRGEALRRAVVEIDLR